MVSTILTGGKHGKEFQHFIAEQYPELKCIRSSSTEESVKFIQEVEAIAGFNFLPSMDLGHIKWIHSFGAGIDSFLEHQLSSDLLLTKTTGEMGQRIAEYCLTYILKDLQKVQHFQNLQKNKKWEQRYLPQIKDVHVYIFGTGFIGQAIATLLSKFTQKVVGINTRGSQVNSFTSCISLQQSKNFSYEENAIFINALPLTANTNKLLDNSFFKLWRKALFINIGRGGSVNDEDLLMALEKDQMRSAILDVFVEEPLPEKSIFWSHPKVTITPHISGITSFSDITSSFQSVYEAMKNGTIIPNKINLASQY